MEMKRVLLICPCFFEYHLVICDGIKKLGIAVDWYDDLPSEKNIVRALGRLNINYIETLTKAYFNRMMERICLEHYDSVIIIRSMSFCFTNNMIWRLKEIQKDAEFVMYFWDSLANLKNLDCMWKYFDRCYSFDPDDVEKYERLKLLPLFYSKPYELVERGHEEPLYDCFYYGTAHPQKLVYINDMAKQLGQIYKKMFIYHYMPSKFKFIYHKFKNKEYRGWRFSDFETRKLSMQEMADYVSRSRYILDSPQRGQRGLTMRSVEVLGAKRKLITINSDIKNYDFYREENIYVFEGQFDFSSKFFSEPYKELPSNIYNKYSLRSWLCTILGIDAKMKQN